MKNNLKTGEVGILLCNLIELNEIILLKHCVSLNIAVTICTEDNATHNTITLFTTVQLTRTSLDDFKIKT